MKQLNNILNGIDFDFDGAIYHLPTLGAHQVKNAVLCINVVNKLGINEPAIKKGLTNLVLPIRMEAVSRKPLIILDGAHNPDKMKTTVNTIRQITNQKSKIKNLKLVVGFAANKNISNMVKQLANLKPATIAVTRFTSNIMRRAADPKTLALMFKKYLPKTKTAVFLDPLEALAWGCKQQGKNDVLLATGSIFLSGQLRTFFKQN